MGMAQKAWLTKPHLLVTKNNFWLFWTSLDKFGQIWTSLGS